MLKSLLLATAALAIGTTAALAEDLSAKSWDDITAQAKQEGELNWYVWYFQDDFRKAVAPFEEKYGIKVNIPAGGTASGNADKLLAASNADKGDIDVFAWGFDDMATLDYAKMFQKLSMLPEDAGRVGKVNAVDGDGYVLAYWGNQTGIAYDPAKVDAAELPQTPDDFAAFWQAHPGQFGFNYENGGSGPSFFKNVLRVISGDDFADGTVTDAKLSALEPGYDFFNKYADDYVITTSNADSIIRISDGELAMAPAWEDHLSSLQNSGEVRKDLKLYIPSMGMNGGGNGVALPVNAPHPAAAALFIAWLTSPETQTMFNTTFGTAPMNANADDSHALIPNSQRQYRVADGAQPFRKAVENGFVDNVILER
ncbi:extracellular solute-binding protein [Martelella alba]|uniref:Extracellular solute-binding protein n=1 Tax=Martelella alba TaxID=2590451 RepID=A0A506U534_9HYPH|nr:extracellular solute-binding protein [Martelella alba]TPW27659.1 extracellular solute-binding protein [Martelella alba]